MAFEPRPLLRLSICPCGTNMLYDDIPLGFLYEIDITQRTGATCTCGSCGRRIELEMVRVKNGKWLPAALFEAQN